MRPVAERAGDNLLPQGGFDGGGLDTWKVDNNRGRFAVTAVPGRHGNAAALASTTTSDRGKFHSACQVPAGADLRLTFFAKPEDHIGGTWLNFAGQVKGIPSVYLAGGSADWTPYVHRFNVPVPEGVEAGAPIKLALWFYVYGEGRVLLDQLELRVIRADPEAAAAANAAGADALRAAWRDWSGPKPRAAPAGDLDAVVRAYAQAASGADGWGALVTDGLHRVLRDAPYRDDFATELRLDMARHEFEGAQVLVMAYDQSLTDVRVSVGDLNGLPDAVVQVLPVGYGDRSQAAPRPWYEGPTSSTWPDPLLPDRNFTVESGTVQPVYLRVYVPADAKPGSYEGRIAIASSAGRAELPLLHGSTTSPCPSICASAR